MPILHASPLNNWLLTMMFVGATVVLMRLRPTASSSLMEREKITSVFGAPIAFIGPVQMAKAKGESPRTTTSVPPTS